VIPLAPIKLLLIESVTSHMSPTARALPAGPVYESVGWRLDADLVFGDDLRAVQLTHPGSGCSVSFGKGLTTAEPGSAQRMELAVYDIEATRGTSSAAASRLASCSTATGVTSSRARILNAAPT
jgi:hypothetical protein